MKKRLYFILSFTAISLSLSAVSPAYAEEKKSALDKSIDSAQKAYDEGKYPRAERAWLRVSKELSKNAPDERLAKAMCSLGDCYIKEGKYTLAEDSFKQSLDVLKGLSKDQTDILQKLKELGNLYRLIKFEAIDKDAVAFANQVGAISASAENKDDKHHIDINLKERFQQGIDELINNAPPGSIPLDKSGDASKSADTTGGGSGATGGGSGSTGSGAGSAGSGSGSTSSGSGSTSNGSSSTASASSDSAAKTDSPQVKKLRLDKKITFDLIKQTDDGKVTIANIQGISLDVGLWVKLKQFAMLINENKKPVADVTAGAFGVEKVVRIDLPGKLYDKLKEGLAKFDPFSLSAMQAAAAAETSGDKQDGASTPAAPATPPAGSKEASQN